MQDMVQGVSICSVGVWFLDVFDASCKDEGGGAHAVETPVQFMTDRCVFPKTGWRFEASWMI